jgi:hypothetical protein
MLKNVHIKRKAEFCPQGCRHLPKIVTAANTIETVMMRAFAFFIVSVIVAWSLKVFFLFLLRKIVTSITRAIPAKSMVE